MCFLSSKKAASASAVHRKSFLSTQFLSVLKKGKDLSADLGKKRFKAAILPLRLCTSFFVVGDFMSRTAWTLLGFALMLCFPTMWPRNFPSSNPKEHLTGLSFMF